MSVNIKIYGIVQGVGFRPFVARLAERFSIAGTVANKGSYVEIVADGSDSDIKKFVETIRAEAPPRSHIIDVDVRPLETAFEGETLKGHGEFANAQTAFEGGTFKGQGDFADAQTAFEGATLKGQGDFANAQPAFEGGTFKGRAGGKKFLIIDSTRESGNIFVSPDIALCEKCRAELFDRSNRRYLHPFINCTDCGPRLTILKRMPYDRERTSMSAFPMCDACSKEYYDPASRRFDAQPVCCNECGPEIFILDGEERGLDAVSKVRRVIADGGIAAIKGIGGFHLACDAFNHSAVERLRRKKYRPFKPFAVMFKDLAAVERECIVDEKIIPLLDGHQKPIVLLEKKSDGRIASNVAPFNRQLGAMLPYTPLHCLIFDLPDGQKIADALIMTSGNISGAPIAIDDDDARQLSSIADVILSHDREILIRADDSVVDGDGSMIRRSRGYAPLPIAIDLPLSDEILAIGGELKNSFCLTKGNLFYMSPYVGDLTDLGTVDALKHSIDRLIELLEIRPKKIVCDLHPRYQSTLIAEELSTQWEIPLVKVQHHYAHILSCMAENNFFDRVIGVAFDGTGYGSDGTIWGGEFLIADLNGFERFASIDPLTQAGGDLSSIDAWRSAVSMIAAINGIERTKKIAAELNLANDFLIDGQLFLIKNNINSVRSTSAGRLFDAAAAVLGLCQTSTFEGDAAMRLQYAAESAQSDPINRAAKAFHIGLSKFIVQTCIRARAIEHISTVALSGGVFQNALLRSLTVKRLEENNFKVLTQKKIPANDGGLAFGQALYASGKGGNIR